MIFDKKSKWIQILIYDYSGNKFLLEGRKNLKTGHLEFKNTRINTPFNLLQRPIILPVEPADQLQKLIDL